ncbi:MFS transporter [Promicromonospora sp. Populi]|uniref:MFS transporter n=1 Tax=Promicromonospora sp. Populi TaxID=3239420 RepID=UPI0034E1D7E8
MSIIGTSDSGVAEGRGLTGARIAVAAAFFAQGFVFISLTTRLPAFLERWGLDEVTLSLLLLMMILLAGVGSLVTEWVVRHSGSAVMLRLGLWLMVLAVPALTLAPAVGVFVGGIAVYGLALGLVDATTNMQAVDLEHRYGRPILPSSHGYWTTGGILAAVVALATGHLSPTIGVFVAVVPLVIAFAPYLPRVARESRGVPGMPYGGASLTRPVVNPVVTTPSGLGTTATGSGAGTVGAGTSAAGPIPWGPIWLVGIGLVVFYMADTAAAAWGPVLLALDLGAPSNLVALASLPYLVASMLVRLAGGALVTRFGVVVLLRVGAVVAFGALALVALAPSWPVAVAGFAILGGSIALVAPLSFSAAGRIAALSATGPAAGSASGSTEPDRARTDTVIARFNQFNYLGALLGAVLTGFVGAFSLRAGFFLSAVLVLALIPLAPAFARGTLRRPESEPVTGPGDEPVSRQ